MVLPVNGTDGARVEAGRNGGGAVTIDGGTTINLESGSSTDEFEARPKIDVGDGGTGTVTISGAGTAVNLIGTNSGSKLEVGSDGNVGTLEILDGAEVTLIDDGPVIGDDNEDVFLQFGEDLGIGTLKMVNGSIDARGSSKVGVMFGVIGGNGIGGTGTLDMLNSSITLNALGGDDFAFVAIGGFGEEGVGTAKMDASTFTFSGLDRSGYVGVGVDSAEGSLSLLNGSNFSMFGGLGQTAQIGNGDGGSDLVALEGASAACFATDGEMSFALASSAGSVGKILLDGSSTMTVSGSSGVVQIGSQASTTTTGSGTLEVLNGAVFDSSVGIQVGPTFLSTNNQTGTIALNNGTVKAPELAVGTGGSLIGNGTVDAIKTVLAGGTISPGLSPGNLTFTGDLEVLSGTLLLEVGGTSPFFYDIINVGGALSATSMFDFIIKIIDGFEPAATDTFAFINAGTIDPSFLSFANVKSDAPFSFNLTDGVLAASLVPTSPVPLPPGFFMLLSAIAGLDLVKLRRGWQYASALG